jgi:hypothetical protein
LQERENILDEGFIVGASGREKAALLGRQEDRRLMEQFLNSFPTAAVHPPSRIGPL